MNQSPRCTDPECCYHGQACASSCRCADDAKAAWAATVARTNADYAALARSAELNHFRDQRN